MSPGGGGSFLITRTISASPSASGGFPRGLTLSCRFSVPLHRDPGRHRAHIARLLRHHPLALSTAPGGIDPPREGAESAAAILVQPERQPSSACFGQEPGRPAGLCF